MTNRIPVIGLGAGGHAKVIIEILQARGQYQLIGLLDRDESRIGQTVMGVPILGNDALLPGIREQGVDSFFVGLGGAFSLGPRRRLYELALHFGLAPLTAIHAKACVSSSATIGSGAAIMGAAAVCSAAQLGNNVIVNTSGIVEHDCVVGNHAHIATGAVLAGGVSVGDETLVGAGSVIRQGVRVGTRCLIGAGAVVVKDVPDGKCVVGNPAKPMAIRR